MTVRVSFKDSYNQNLSESLMIDFSELKKDGREVKGQYGELDEIRKILEKIEHKIK